MQAFRGLLLVALLLVTTISQTLAIGLNMCIDSTACQCLDDDVIRCQCPKDYSRISLLPYHLFQHKKLVSFLDCDEVVINSMSLSSTPPNTVEIVGVRKLVLHPSAYLYVHNIDGISIVDTVMDDIESHAFFGMAHIARIEFRNVTIGHVRPAAFQSLNEIDFFLIQDCTIDTIHRMAFNDTTNIKKFAIVNSIIRDFGQFAMVLRNVKDFIMANTTVLNWRNQSLTLVNATQVQIDSCHFRTMEASALTTILTNRVVVTRNVFERLSANAWNGVADADHVVFVDNHIRKADSDSLTLLLRKNPGNEVKNNFLSCDEHVCWLFDDESSGEGANVGDAMFFNSNYCLENGTTFGAMTLSRFSSLADDEDICHSDRTSGEGSYVSSDQANVTLIGLVSKSSRNFSFTGIVALIVLCFILPKALD